MPSCTPVSPGPVSPGHVGASGLGATPCGVTPCTTGPAPTGISPELMSALRAPAYSGDALGTVAAAIEAAPQGVGAAGLLPAVAGQLREVALKHTVSSAPTLRAHPVWGRVGNALSALWHVCVRRQ